MSRGIETRGSPLTSRGYSTCALTTPSIVSLSFPIDLATANASSRFGPIWAEVPACASSWQTPHFWTNSVRPRAGSAVVVPQPEAVTTKATIAKGASSGEIGFGGGNIGGNGRGGVYGGAPG